MGESLQFKDKVVLITGAGGGLGREYALAFASRGASVVVNDLGGSADGSGKSTSLADRVVNEIRAAGGKAAANHESVENGEELVKKALAAFGRIDILINNAGILRDHSFANMSLQDWDLIHQVHLRGSFLVTKAVWPHMKKQGYGRIVMACSTSGIFGNFGQANYGAAKMGLYGLNNTLAAEGAKYNILCNTIAPIADSRLTKGTMSNEISEKASPKLVAPFVLYLCHDSCTETKGLFFIVGGYGAELRWQQSTGVNLLSGKEEVTPEMVRDHWTTLKDWSKASYPKSTSEAVAMAMYGDQLTDQTPSNTQQAPDVYTYSFKDAIQYALGVGVVVKDDYSHLKFLYEGHEDFSVLPSFAVIPAQAMVFGSLGKEKKLEGIKINLAKALHGEQYVELYRPLLPNGSLKSKVDHVEVLDKGSGALIISNVTTSDEKGPVCFNQFVIFAVGSGGFGGKRQSEHIKPLVAKPSRAPDVVEEEKTTKSQAAHYRLMGDYNPLHIDPDFAAMGGFQSPILHGLCSFGYAVRHVLKHFCGNDVTKFKAAKVRFSKSVLPGQTIRTEMWKEGNRVLMQCKVAETGDVLLSGGYVELHSHNTSLQKTPGTDQPEGSDLKSDALFQLMSDRLPAYPHLVKKVKASFLWRITGEGGKVKSEWTTDFTREPGSVFRGKPSSKANCTVTIADADFVDVAMGKTNPQQLFMKGKIKIAGSIMLAQKLQIIMKEIDLKKVMPAASGEGAKSDLKSRAVFVELQRRIKSMPDLGKKVKASFLWNVTKDGKTAGQWLVNLKPSEQTITEGAPKIKPDCTVTVADDAMADMFAGKTNPQQLFMKGGLKVAGNIGLMMKLGELLKPQAKL